MVLHEETVRPVVILFYILFNAMTILLYVSQHGRRDGKTSVVIQRYSFAFQFWMILLLAHTMLVIRPLQISI